MEAETILILILICLSIGNAQERVFFSFLGVCVATFFLCSIDERDGCILLLTFIHLLKIKWWLFKICLAVMDAIFLRSFHREKGALVFMRLLVIILRLHEAAPNLL